MFKASVNVKNVREASAWLGRKLKPWTISTLRTKHNEKESRECPEISHFQSTFNSGSGRT